MESTTKGISAWRERRREKRRQERLRQASDTRKTTREARRDDDAKRSRDEGAASGL